MLNHLDSYYFSQPEPYQSCLLFLRNFLLNYSTEIEEHWKYTTAFFTYKKKMFCYFSINKKTKQLYIGFVDGNKINHKKLVAEGRKQIKILYINPEKDIDVKALREILKFASKLCK
ncbi:MAG: DUF1801 domain-containing protein [Bacteroidetes bacterium]|nr:DUF1801 domain-containing protein [Bacteroidota bacterium]